MKNIHILSKSIFDQLGVDHYGKTPTQIKIAEFLINKNIYITSNEEIKERDWTLMFDSFGHLFLCDKPQQYLGIEKGHHLNKGLRKIILTTDQDLIKDGVQEIDDEFLEWFVKNPSCEYVHVYKEHKQINQDNIVTKGSTALVFSHYVIYIPKEELQDVFFTNKSESSKVERMYSEEEVNEIIAEVWNSCEDNEGETFIEVRKRILEQLKNKKHLKMGRF
jgi:hypothetical protein